MKTKQEILDFYGVEIGKKYKITKTSLYLSDSKIFTIKEDEFVYGGLKLRFEGGLKYNYPIAMLNNCCYEEIKPSILDNTEKRYLQKYVMDNPALKGKVIRIAKYTDVKAKNEFVRIYLNNYDTMALPYFPVDTMYKGMAKNIKYTPQELGLEE